LLASPLRAIRSGTAARRSCSPGPRAWLNPSPERNRTNASCSSGHPRSGAVPARHGQPTAHPLPATGSQAPDGHCSSPTPPPGERRKSAADLGLLRTCEPTQALGLSSPCRALGPWRSTLAACGGELGLHRQCRQQTSGEPATGRASPKRSRGNGGVREPEGQGRIRPCVGASDPRHVVPGNKSLPIASSPLRDPRAVS
jgi:hypothetical protein